MAQIYPSAEDPQAELALAELEEKLREIFALGQRRRDFVRALDARRELTLRIACSIAAERYITVAEAEEYIDVGSAELRPVKGRPFLPNDEIARMLVELRDINLRLADCPWSTAEEASSDVTARIHRFVTGINALRSLPDGTAMAEELARLAKSLSCQGTGEK